MTRRLIAFDLDDTVTVSKSKVSDGMAQCVSDLLRRFDVAIISGGKFGQFKDQLIDHLSLDDEARARLHILPTSGTRYYRYHADGAEWLPEYVEDLSEEEKATIISVLVEAAAALDLAEAKTYGPVIEDRGSQITYSALGQLAPPELKYQWDPQATKKRALRDWAAPKLPNMSVRMGGSTSVDVTRIGVDKSYGMRRLIELNGLRMEDVLFFGDQLGEGGNDHPVLELGIECISVRNCEETEVAIRAILAAC